jgi:hypothetical protein
MDPSENKIAECIGLWLAEGDNKTKYEITFTNNEFYLIKYFHETLSKLFKIENLKIRIYIYTPSKLKHKIPIKNIRINNYIDTRANKPYFIWRFASVNSVSIWKNKVKKILENKEFYPDILRGFFAGEGSISYSKDKKRMLRISQSKRVNFIERVLEDLQINYNFSTHHREGYVISRRGNLEKLEEIKIADLHPIKRKKFQKMMKEYKQRHYEKYFLKKNLIKHLNKKYYTAKQLANYFKRSPARVSEVLVELKKENKLKFFKIKSECYWINYNINCVIISKIKMNYIKLLEQKSQKTKELSIKLKVCQRTAKNRLKELERLKLVKRNPNKIWELKKTNKEVIVL